MSEADEDPAGDDTESRLGVQLYSEHWGREEAELEYHRRAFGQTYRERHGREHKKCIVLCLNPGQRGAARCPCCFGKVGVRPMDEAPDIEPMPTRGERLAGWAGACAAAFWEAFMLPFRLSQQHRVAIVRNVLQDAMAAGLHAEVEIVQVCPACGTTGEKLA